MMKHFRNGLVFITILGMQICWLYTILNSLNKSINDILSLPLLLLTLLLSLGISVFLKHWNWPKVALTAVSWVIWPPVMLLMIKLQLFPGADFTDSAWLGSLPHAFSQVGYKLEPSLLIFIITAILWWLGRRMAYLKPDFSTSLTELQLGLVILAITFFIAYQLNLDQPGSQGVTISFFFLALLGVAAAHAQDNSWLFSPQKGHWAGITLVCILIIILIGLLASVIFTPDLIQLLITVIKWIWGIFEKIIGFLAGLFPSFESVPMETVPLPAVPPGEENVRLFTVPDWLRSLLNTAWIVMVCGLILAAIWQTVSQIFKSLRRHSPTGQDAVESLKGAFKEDLLKFIKRILRFVFRFKSADKDHGHSKNVPPQVIFTRQIYAQFLRWTAGHGYPRPESQTPEEYFNRLAQLKPESRDALELITAEYMSVRYGAGVPTDAQLNRLRQKWQELKKSGFKKIAK
jgi:hypothetical protein